MSTKLAKFNGIGLEKSANVKSRVKPHDTLFKFEVLEWDMIEDDIPDPEHIAPTEQEEKLAADKKVHHKNGMELDKLCSWIIQIAFVSAKFKLTTKWSCSFSSLHLLDCILVALGVEDDREYFRLKYTVSDGQSIWVDSNCNLASLVDAYENPITTFFIDFYSFPLDLDSLKSVRSQALLFFALRKNVRENGMDIYYTPSSLEQLFTLDAQINRCLNEQKQLLNKEMNEIDQNRFVNMSLSTWLAMYKYLRLAYYNKCHYVFFEATSDGMGEEIRLGFGPEGIIYLTKSESDLEDLFKVQSVYRWDQLKTCGHSLPFEYKNKSFIIHYVVKEKKGYVSQMFSCENNLAKSMVELAEIYYSAATTNNMLKRYNEGKRESKISATRKRKLPSATGINNEESEAGSSKLKKNRKNLN